MEYLRTKFVTALVVLMAVAGLTIPSVVGAQTSDEIQPPVLPSPVCSTLQVQSGNEAFFRAYALGVQRYKWNGAAWDFVAPEATLYADPDFRGKIGTHYGGPTWESNSGSNVVARRVDGCSPDPTAIDWLLLQTVSTTGPGLFSNVTFIQRVNTAGGLRPVAPGEFVGQEKRVPYTTEYYFYRANE